MKALASTYTAGNNGTIQTIAHCWRVILKNETILGFTDFEHDLTFAGLTYISAEGFAPTDVDSNFSGSGQVSISSFFGDQVTRPELDGGIFEDATVEFMRVNWASLPTDLDAIPRQYDLLVRGKVGITNYGDRRYTLQFRGLADDLKARNGWQCQKDCRYQFGDKYCKKVPSSPTETCGKTEADCQGKGNILNFGGEGIIPGQSGFAKWGSN
jgi:uncharacterized phage protein (TIGR02218 family)